MKTKVAYGEEQYLYETEEEFRQEYPDEPIIPWREGRVGDWVATDEGGVVQVLKEQVLNHRGDEELCLKTICGLKNVLRGPKMTNEIAENIHSLSGRAPNSSKGRRRDHPSAREWELLTRFFIKGEDPAVAYMNTYRTNDPEYAYQRFEYKLREEHMQEAVSMTFKQILTDAGIADEDLAREIKSLLNDEEMSASDKLNVLKFVAELRGHTGRTRSVEYREQRLIHGTKMNQQQISQAQLLLGRMEDADTEEYAGGDDPSSEPDTDTD